MAKLIIDNIEYAIPDGAPIATVCEQAGVPFNCNTGVCGSCKVKIISGAEHLTSLTPEERSLGLDKNNRLACQCAIKTGVVKITY